MNVDQALRDALREQPLPSLDVSQLLDEVASRRSRQRYRTVAACSATAAVIILVAGALTHTSAPLVRERVDTPATSTTTTPFTPTYLPPGASLRTDRPDADALGHLREWSLPGRANADTIGAGGVQPPATNLDQHPATTLQLVVRDLRAFGGAQPELTPPSSSQFDIGSLALRGTQVAVTQPRSGLGVFRIDWVERGFYVHLACERLQTASGLSGLPLQELVRIAEGLR